MGSAGPQRIRSALHIALALALAGAGLPLRGHETDHFTPAPPRPFADLGGALTRLMYDKLTRAVAQANERIDECRKLAARNGRAASPELRRLHSPDYITRAVCEQFGTAGFFITDLDLYLRGSEFQRRYPGLTVTHWPSPCVYDRALVVPVDPRKLYLLWRASVLNIDGTLLGTDKIGHFVHHGYNYYLEYQAAERAGCNDAECRRRAASLATGGHFFFSERMLLGTLTSGVVSNADLAANYVGLLFYLNLTREVRVGGAPRPPLLLLENGKWRLAGHVHPQGDFLTVFMSDHMDEALNPNLYDGLTAAVIRNVAKPWCAELRRAYSDENGEPRPPGWFRRRAEELRTYFGEDYGHCGGAGLVGLAMLCDCETPLPDNPVTRLHAAAGAGDLESVGALLASGADVNARLASRDAAWGEPGDTALHAAVRSGRAETAKRLLRAGADPAARTSRAATPLHLAAADEQCTALLLEEGADPNARDAFGRTPLQRAVRANQCGVARRLLVAGASTSAADCDGQTPLHEAVRAGATEITAVLLGQRAAPGVAALYGETPLHLAAQTGRADLALVLLEAGAPVSLPDEFGRTPLHRAAAAGHSQVAALLVERGADIRGADVNGTTPLHLAARVGDSRLLDLLIQRGADLSARSRIGRTPAAEARLAGHARLVKQLESAEVRSRTTAGGSVQP